MSEGLHDGHRERMKKKYEDNGIDCLADHEKLEVLLYSVFSRINTNDISHRLINRFGSLHGVFMATESELCQVKGIGANAAFKIRYMSDFFRKLTENKTEPPTLDNVSDIARYCRSFLNFSLEEQTIALFLDKKHQLISKFYFPSSQPNASQVDIKLLAKRALDTNCVYAVLVHNHSNSNLMPSTTDMHFTRKAYSSLKTIGVELLDHIIIDEFDEYSLRSSQQLLDLWLYVK